MRREADGHDMSARRRRGFTLRIIAIAAPILQQEGKPDFCSIRIGRREGDELESRRDAHAMNGGDGWEGHLLDFGDERNAAREALALFDHGIVDQSEKNLSVMRQATTLGQLRLIDVLNEQRRLIDTEMAYIDAQTELAQATAELEQAVGSDLP